MPKLRSLQAVDEAFPTTGPNRTTMTQPIERPAEVVFRILKDGPAWKEWLGVDVEWTSPEPFGVGTTRTVRGGGQVMEEYFIAWDEGSRMAFRFDASTLPLTAFAEEWTVEPTGDRTSKLRWTYAFDWAGPVAAVTGPVFGTLFKLNGRRSLRRLAHYAASTDAFN
ncbi:MAG: SRPBCC family protein [Actinomycetota bacterium]